MDHYEDFEFSSPLSAGDALKRLGQYKINPGNGTFYGEVKGNYFTLSHDAGSKKVNPQLSGYILAEGAGCRIFARTHVIGTLDTYAYAVMVTFGSCIYVLVKHPDLMEPFFVFLKSHKLLVLGVGMLICILAIVAGRYILKKFRKQGRFQVISKFMDYLDADYQVDSAALK